METQKTIKIWFKVETERGSYQDALYFTDAEFKFLKQADIEAQAQARADAWVEFVKNPPPVPEPTKEELQEKADAIAQQIESLENEKLELEDKVSKI